MTFTTERSGGTITVSPKNEADQSGLVVICHGLGDTADGFSDVAEVSDVRSRRSGMINGCILLYDCATTSLQITKYSSRTSLVSTEICARNASFEVHLADGTDAGRHYEYGDGHAILV